MTIPPHFFVVQRGISAIVGGGSGGAKTICMSEDTEPPARDSMEFDVVIAGAGPPACPRRIEIVTKLHPARFEKEVRIFREECIGPPVQRL
jgi:hypothetical protein